jgi:purine-binding chemotaxis protein CheW
MATDSDRPQLVVFTLGEEHYALPVQQVQEIIRYTAPRSIASSAEWVRGVISLRGRLVPVYDLASRLGIQARADELAKIVIVDGEDQTAGVIVDTVVEVLTVDESSLEVAPTADTSVIQSILRDDDRLIAVLTLDTLLNVVGPDQGTEPALLA